MAEVVTKKEFIATFGTDYDTKVNVSVSDPVDTLDAEQASNAADALIGTNVFQDANGNPITQAETAKIRTTTENILF